MNEHVQWKKKRNYRSEWWAHRQTNRITINKKLYQLKSKLNVMLDGFFDLDIWCEATKSIIAENESWSQRNRLKIDETVWKKASTFVFTINWNYFFLLFVQIFANSLWSTYIKPSVFVWSIGSILTFFSSK